jgi:hypothetical protein
VDSLLPNQKRRRETLFGREFFMATRLRRFNEDTPECDKAKSLFSVRQGKKLQKVV